MKGRIAALPKSERPREKLLAKGPEALSDIDLVALLLGTGSATRGVLETAEELLARGGLPGLARRGAVEILTHRHGIGAAKAARLAAVIEIARRVARDELQTRDIVSDPESAGRYLTGALATETREVMGALLLDTRNRLLEDFVVFRGTVSHASVSPAPLFREAIVAGAAGLVLYHLHPSGDPEPSAEDRVTTDRFVRAGREIGIPVRDHLVVGRGRWVSFLRRGLLTA